MFAIGSSKTHWLLLFTQPVFFVCSFLPRGDSLKPHRANSVLVLFALFGVFSTSENSTTDQFFRLAARTHTNTYMCEHKSTQMHAHIRVDAHKHTHKDRQIFIIQTKYYTDTLQARLLDQSTACRGWKQMRGNVRAAAVKHGDHSREDAWSESREVCPTSFA